MEFENIKNKFCIFKKKYKNNHLSKINEFFEEIKKEYLD